MNKIWAYEICKWFSFYLHFTNVPGLLEWGLYIYNAFNNNVLSFQTYWGRLVLVQADNDVMSEGVTLILPTFIKHYVFKLCLKFTVGLS